METGVLAFVAHCTLLTFQVRPVDSRIQKKGGLFLARLFRVYVAIDRSIVINLFRPHRGTQNIPFFISIDFHVF